MLLRLYSTFCESLTSLGTGLHAPAQQFLGSPCCSARTAPTTSPSATLRTRRRTLGRSGPIWHVCVAIPARADSVWRRVCPTCPYKWNITNQVSGSTGPIRTPRRRRRCGLMIEVDRPDRSPCGRISSAKKWTMSWVVKKHGSTWTRRPVRMISHVPRPLTIPQDIAALIRSLFDGRPANVTLLSDMSEMRSSHGILPTTADPLCRRAHDYVLVSRTPRQPALSPGGSSADESLANARNVRINGEK